MNPRSPAAIGAGYNVDVQAAGPSGPDSVSKLTFAPSANDLKPLPWIAL